MNERLARDGFAIGLNLLDDDDAAALIDGLSSIGSANTRGHGEVYAIRNLLDVPAVRALAESAAVRALVEPLLGLGAFAVRGILFDKTAAVKWRVPWHQDLTIAVQTRQEVPGYGPWSLKAGVPHVLPPIAVLERMLTVRLHLDACGATNGPLRVVPGSHRDGILSRDAIRHWRESVPAITCEVPRGGTLLVRPLLLHASTPAIQPGHCRVVHLEFAANLLPGGLVWHEARPRH
jgi:hypothetical protein